MTRSAAAGKRSVAMRRRPDGTDRALPKVMRQRNISRQQQLRLSATNRDLKTNSATEKLRARLMAKRRQEMEQKKTLKKAINKKSNKPFEHDLLKVVNDGLCETIAGCGESVTPLTLFALGCTTAGAQATQRRHIPYLLTIIAACVPKLSQGVINARLTAVFDLAASLIAEAGNTDHLTTTKALKLIQAVTFACNPPTPALVAHLRAATPNKLNGVLMPFFATTIRKFLQGAAAAGHTEFFLESLPEWTTVLCGNLFETRESVSKASKEELVELFTRTGLPHLMRTPEQRAQWNAALAPVCNLFKNGGREHWVLASEAVVGIFQCFAHVKRTEFKEVMAADARGGDGYFSQLFPNAKLLLRIMDKIRCMDDETLNTPIERAMVSIASCMTAREVLHILPFDPHHDPLIVNKGAHRTEEDEDVEGGEDGEDGEGHDDYEEDSDDEADASDDNGAKEEMVTRKDKQKLKQQQQERRKRGGHKGGFKRQKKPAAPSPAMDPWLRSYIVGVLRRCINHDSLPHFVSEFLPRIADCAAREAEARATPKGREVEIQQWMVLQEQYWRVAAAYCNFPLEVTEVSFRNLAKALIGLLGNAHLAPIACNCLHALCGGYYKLSSTDETDKDLYDDEDEDDEDEEDDAADDGDASRRKKRNARVNDLEVNPFTDVNDSEMNPHLFHCISKAQAQQTCQIFAKFSVNIMPKLCNTFETLECTSILQAITSFSRVCTAQVMGSILSGILNLASGGAAALLSAAPPAGEGGAAAASTDSKLPAKRRIVLDIAAAMISQLPAKHLEALFTQVIEPVLMDRTAHRILQKKAYKLFYGIFEHRLTDMRSLLPRMNRLIVEGQQTVSVSGIKLRLKCLSWSLDAYKMFSPAELPTLIKSLLPEVVMCTKQQAHESRVLAMEMLERMHQYSISVGCRAVDLLHQVLAGLAGKTPLLVACSIVALAKLLWIGHEAYEAKDVTAVVSMCVGLMEHSVPEIRHGAATFTRMILKLVKRGTPKVVAAVEAALPRLLLAIALVTSQPHLTSSTRREMRQLTEKAIKRYGQEKVQALFPMGSMRFMLYVARQYRRSEKVKAKHQQRSEEEEAARQVSAFNKLFLSDGAGGGMRMGGAGVSGNGAEGGDGDEDEDLLGGGGLRRLVAHGVMPTQRGRKNGDDDADDARDDAVVVMEDGKVRIMTKAQKATEDEAKRRRELAQRLLAQTGRVMGPNVVNVRGLNSGETVDRKRKRDDVTDFENEELLRRYGDSSASAARLEGGVAAAAMRRVQAAAPSALTQALREQTAAQRDAKRQRLEKDIKTGAEFENTTALGDHKQGNLEPFAYVPLHPKYLNKRHVAVSAKRFKAVEHKGLKGAKAQRALSQMGKR